MKDLKNIAFFVCPNGLGHLRRSISIIKTIIKIRNVKVKLFVSKSKENSFLIDFFKKLPRTEICFFYLPHPAYDKNEYEYSEVLKNLKPLLKDIDVLISDNLIYPLSVLDIHNKFCIAQFFWHDLLILDQLSKNSREIVDLEIASLEKNKFVIYGSNLFSMPAVSNHKLFKPIELVENPLFSKPTKVKKRKGVLITDGTTKFSRDYLNKITPDIIEISLNYGLDVFISPRLSNKNNFHKVKKFDYTSKDFSKILVGICRPGLGIISDLLYSGAIPIPCFSEVNAEMEFNKEQINKLFGFQASKNINFHLETAIKNFANLQIVTRNIKFIGGYQIKDDLMKRINVK